VGWLLGREGVDTEGIYTTPSKQALQRKVEQIALAWRDAKSEAGTPAPVSN
jgi:hypothetical protein